MSATNLPEIKSGKIVHLSELSSWSPDEVHGNSIRVLGRVKSVDCVGNSIVIEYHMSELQVNTTLLRDNNVFVPGNLFEFLGDLDARTEQMILHARLCRDMSGLNSDVYDRCVRIRRDFENTILRDSLQK